MKQLFAAIKRSPRRSAALLTLAAALIVPATMFAWGPSSRPTYTYQNPAPHVTFNSMTGTPNYGDERNFVRIKEANASNSTYTDNINFTPGKEYSVMVYFHNNAKPSLNGDDYNGEGVAKNARMSIQMPQTVKAGEKARITGTVRADNATPEAVWDEAWGQVDTNVELRYVYDSAVIYSNGDIDGQKMPNSLYTPEGALLGYDKLDGKVPGCNEYAGYVVFKIKVHKPSFQMAKEVTKHGGKEFKNSINAKPGDKVDFRIAYRNNGTTQQNNVVIKDTLPKGLSYVQGSGLLASSASNGQYTKTSDNLMTSKGINIGHYAPNGNAFFKFTAKVDNKNLECGINRLINKATVETNNGSKSDTAEVIVEKKCEQPKPKKIEVCDLNTKKIITIDEDKFDSSKHSKNLKDCEEKPQPKTIKVCELSTKKIITIDEDKFDSSKHSKDFKDCEEIPVTPEEPEVPEQPEKPEEPEAPEEEPEVPAELPQTGLAGNLITMLSLGALTAGSVYAIRGVTARQ